MTEPYMPNGEPRPCIIGEFVISYVGPTRRPVSTVVTVNGTQYGRKTRSTINDLDRYIRDLQRIRDFCVAELDEPKEPSR